MGQGNISTVMFSKPIPVISNSLLVVGFAHNQIELDELEQKRREQYDGPQAR